jgi:adenine-specific DNA-methyltransferase
VNDKKRNGKFYTPDPATQLLCSWAIQSPEDSVLEPSFGGCGFLVAARDRLESLGAESANKNLFGCDIDPEAFLILERTLGGDYDRRNFVLADFLTLGSGAFHRKAFTAIIGNPPYVSLHNMEMEQRERARSTLSKNEGLSAKASLWAYFVLHVNTFLARGGRAAWLLPGSFLYSEYASDVRSALETRFERSLAIELRQRLFLTEGTEETTVIVLCDGRCDRTVSNPMQYTFCEDLAAAEQVISHWQSGVESGVHLMDKPRFLSLSHEQQLAYDSIGSRNDVTLLGKYVTCRIGVVTGNNRFFVIRPSEAQNAELTAADFVHVVGKFRECLGICFTNDEIRRRIEMNQRCLLVSSYPDRETSEALLRYLNRLPEETRKANKTFAKREPWHAANDRRCPDAFFPIMQTEGPRIVINEAGVNATNSVYRLYQTGIGDLRRVALGVLSTFSQLGAEIQGRSYGSGGLKMEPSDVLRIPVVTPEQMDDAELLREFNRVHSLLLAGKTWQARREVDAMLFSDSEREQLNLLEVALSETRHRRQRNSKTGGSDAKR